MQPARLPTSFVARLFLTSIPSDHAAHIAYAALDQRIRRLMSLRAFCKPAAAPTSPRWHHSIWPDQSGR